MTAGEATPRNAPGPEPVAAEHRQLWARAAALGVETRYQGADDIWRSASPEAVARVVAVLEADAPGAGADPVGPPVPMPRSADLAGGAALFCPAYALWRPDDRDPSFGQLHRLCREARLRGVDVVSTLPLNAAFYDDPYEPSPYSPVSRLHWNEAYVDPTTIPGAAPEPVGPDGPGAFVDWRDLAARRRRQLLAAVDLLSPSDTAALERWLLANPDVTDYARFRADTDRGAVPTEGQTGPTRHRLVRSYELGQWLADESLRRLAADPAAAGLGLDVPIGCHPHGFETRVHPELFAPGMHVGVPPDLYFPDGQDWGFPPPLPGAGRRSGHALWRRLVERVGRPAALLRIDHVMGVHRLWWIPDGHSPADGVFVRYPALDILAAIAEAASAVDTTVVGENLGTVPPEVTRLMAATATLGMHEEQFTMLAGEPPGEIPADTVAGIRTHDMDAFAAAATQPRSAAYARALGVPDPAADPAGLLDRVLDRMGRSPAYLASVDLDDLEGETRPHNVPGTTDPRGWSRRAARQVDELLDHPDVARRLDLLTESRAAGAATTSITSRTRP
ncbi:MAG: 4-alpha-glucanotransferase [Acidimicrobiales bacterium]